MITDQILKINQSLTDRGLPEGSYFEVEFTDGSIATEKEVNWSSFSDMEKALFMGEKQLCYVSKFPVKNITITLDGLTTTISDIPEGAKVYQYMRSRRLLAQGVNTHSIIGRGAGVIQNGIVVEERFINALEHTIQGVKI